MKNGLAGSASVLLLMLLMVSCTQKDCCWIGDEGEALLIGTWSLYEMGYSPGSGYIVEPVEPGKTLTFSTNREMTSNIQGLSDYHFYVVLDGVIGFFKEDPGPSPDFEAFKHSYNVEYHVDTIKLTYRFCVEGCHIGLRRE